jgi:hypothetical protein
MWWSTASAAVIEDGRRHGPRRRAVDMQREEEDDFFFFCPHQNGTLAGLTGHGQVSLFSFFLLCFLFLYLLFSGFNSTI